MTGIAYDRLFQPVVLARVNGVDANDLVMLMGEIKIHEDDKRLTEVTTNFRAPSDTPGAWIDFLEDPRVNNGAEWTIRWGYFHDMSDPLALVVTKAEPDFTEGGDVKLALTLSSKGAHMTRDSQSKNWGAVDTSSIATQLAAAYGFQTDIEPSNDRRRQPYVQPVNVSDLEYLLRLATTLHWVCYVDGNTLHYHPPRTSVPPVMELVWMAGDENALLKSFKPVIKEARSRRSSRHGEAPAPGTGTGTGTAEETHAGSTDGGHEQPHMGNDIVHTVNLRNRRQGRRGSVSFASRRVASIVDATMAAVASVAAATSGAAAAGQPTAEQDHRTRQRHAHADQRRALEEANEAKATTVGLQALRRGRTFAVRGVPVGLSGNWYIKASTHTIGTSGYATEIELKRAARNGGGHHRTTTPATTEHEAGTPAQAPAQAPQGAPRAAHVNVGNRRVVDPNGRTVRPAR